MVSIIIPCYNYGHYLDECLHSVYEQSYKNFEIIIIDDGSTDDSYEVAKGFAQKHPEISTSTYENGGLAAARNRGIRLAKGEYIFCLDADDLITPDCLEKTVAELEKHVSDGTIGFVYTQYKISGTRDAISNLPEYDLERLKMKNYISACCLFKTNVLKENEYDERYRTNEDQDLYLSLAEKGIRGVLVDEVLFEYRKHEDSLRGKVFRNLVGYYTTGKILRKHKTLYSFKEYREAHRYAKSEVARAVQRGRSELQTFTQRIYPIWVLIRIMGPKKELIRCFFHLFKYPLDLTNSKQD